VADLKASHPTPHLPLVIGNTRLDSMDPGRVTSVAPFPGRDLAPALAPLGLAFPPPGGVLKSGAARIVWAGRDLAFLMRADAPPGLVEDAAITDQSDAWVWVHLSGVDARAVLARLTPLDLRDHAMPVDGTARSTINHMQAIVIRPAAEAYEIAVFRSMAGTLVHELQVAMTGVAARSALV